MNWVVVELNVAGFGVDAFGPFATFFEATRYAQQQHIKWFGIYKLKQPVEA